jgi:peptidoglycan/LPS O-acetylase OafA/YrhL
MSSVALRPVSPVSLHSRSLNERFYHPELDVLRFFAFFLAYLHHSLPHYAEFYTAVGVSSAVAKTFAAIGATGAFGVNLFFLLSAYLITELLIRERQRFGHIDLRAFYIRRILRIWPLYFIFLGFAWILQWVIPSQHIGWRAGMAFVLLSGNWWVFFVGFPASIIFPLWSLSVEEQFYIVWPVTMRRLGARGLLRAAAVMLALASLTRWYLAVHHAWEQSLWTNSFVQLDAIALGVALAVLLRGRSPNLQPLQRVALFLVGMAFFAVAANYFKMKEDPLTVSRVLLGYPTAAVGALLVFLSALGILDGHRIPGASKRGKDSGRSLSAEGSHDIDRRGEANGGKEHGHSLWRRIFAPIWHLSGAPLIYLGRISYGLYVFHVLGLMISDSLVPHAASNFGRYLLRTTLAFAITVGFAAASYRWLETPFLNLKQRFTHIFSRPGG